MADAASNVIDLPARAQRRPKPILDAPVWNLTHAWDVGSVRAALSSLEGGNFQAAAALCDAMDLDDRISGVLDTRVRALLGLDQEWGDPDEESASEDTTVQAFRDAFPQIFPKAQLAELLRWGIRIGVGLGELVWFDRDGKYTPTPRLKVWHPQFLTWRWDTRSFWVTTATAGNVEVTPGDMRWVLYTPHGEQRGWMHGLVRPLSLPFLIRQYANRDSARYSEAYGMPVKQVIVPMGAAQEDKDRALLEVAQLASESTISTPQEEGGPGMPSRKFDFKFHELTGEGQKVFDSQIQHANTNIAILILGQNLTTEAGTGGSHGAYAASKVHDRVRGDVLEFDAVTLASCLHDHGLRPWSVANMNGVEPPEYRWITDAPEDQGAKTLALSQLGDAFDKFDVAEVPIDKRQLAEEYGLPLLTPEEEAALKAEADAKAAADAQNKIAAAAAGAPKANAAAPTAPAADEKLSREVADLRAKATALEADQVLALSVVQAATEIGKAIRGRPAPGVRKVTFERDPVTGATVAGKIEGE
jgi:phage gp29-like protein